MKKLWAIIVLLAMLIIPFSAFALTAKSGENVLLNEAVEGDFYAAGGGVRVNAAVEGDVIAAGGNLRISGTVGGDVLGAAGDVAIDGNIGDDVRLAAGNVEIESEIGGDLVVVGGEVIVDAGAVINGDLVIMGGLAEMWGTVRGDVLVFSGELGLYGTVEGNVKAELDSSLRVAETTKIAGNLMYDAPQETTINEEMVGGQVIFGEKIIDIPETATGDGYWEARISMLAVSLLMTLLIGLVIILLVPNFVAGSAIAVREKPLMTVLVGLGILPVLFLAMMLAFISIIGVKLGLLLMLKLFGTILVAKIFAGYFVGNTILRPKRKLKTIEIFGLFALGLITIEVVALVPILSVFVQIAAYILGLGAMWVAGAKLYKDLKGKSLV